MMVMFGLLKPILVILQSLIQLLRTFTEYDNPIWPDGSRSMMWGIDYAPDGSVWFTDEAFDSVWKFSPLMKNMID